MSISSNSVDVELHIATQTQESAQCTDAKRPVCATQRMCHMIQCFSSAQNNKGRRLNRNQSDVSQCQCRRFTRLLGLFSCAMRRSRLPPSSDPGTLPAWFLLAAREGPPPVTWLLGTSIVKAGRQEAEWKPGHSTVSLSTGPTARPCHCQQAQLGQAPWWPIVHWGTLCVQYLQLWEIPWGRGEETHQGWGEDVTFIISLHRARHRNTSTLWKVERMQSQQLMKELDCSCEEQSNQTRIRAAVNSSDTQRTSLQN